jgi:TetR/AcrR family transcriptional regulator, transcriptional repressor for nem operon
MARYTTEQKQATREKILAAAGKEFRENGIEGATVPGIMARAGLTVGGFYKHYDSKASLCAEVVADTLQDSSQRLARATDGLPKDVRLQAVLDTYLSHGHRDNRASGCVSAALASDLPRSDVDLGAYRAALEETIDHESTLFDGPDARDKAWALRALMIGGLLLARSTDDDTADEILTACKREATRL